MTKNLNSKLMLFAEYKEGFEEVKKIVEGFEDIHPKSQERFLIERMYIFEQQKEALECQKTEVHNEIRIFLSKANSRLKALLDMEKYIAGQISECEEFKELLSIGETASEIKGASSLPETVDAPQNLQVKK